MKKLEDMRTMKKNKEVANSRKHQQLDLLHRRLGHPSNEVLSRMLKMAGADKWLQDAAMKLKCDTCGAGPIPSRPMSQRSDLRPCVFNENIGIDLKFINDCSGQRYAALNMVDLATNYHQAVLLRSRNPGHVAQKFLSKWVAMFGIPTWISLDQGGEWEAEFILFLEHHAVGTKFTGSHAAWQLGHTERHGALLGIAWSALVFEHQVQDRNGMKVTLMCAIQAKNQVVTRRGYSANALVFGRQSVLPDLLEDDAISSTALGQALSTDTEVARQAEMRSLAKRALLHKDAQQKLKNALVRKPGGQIREFLPGEKIYFWVPRARKGRYRRDQGEWRGPAVVITKESHEKYFCSWRARCLLLAAINMRGVTLEENANAGLEDLEDQVLEDKTYEDLTTIKPPAKDTDKDKGWEAQEDVIQTGKRKGRTKRQAVEMLKGLRGVRRLIQSKFQKERHHKPRRQKKPASKKDEEIMRQAAEEYEEFEKRTRPPEQEEYEPTEPGEGMTEEEIQKFLEEVTQQEEAYAKEDDERKKEQVQKRRSLLDDVPICIKRKEPGENDEEPKMKVPRTLFQQLEVMVSDQMMTGKLRKKVMKEEEQGRANQWLKRGELRQLRRLLDLPISAARLHRAPRKKLQRHPRQEEKRRVSLMLLEEPGNAMILDEKKTEVKRNRCSALWRGMTLFIKEQETKMEKAPTEAYIQIGDVVYQKTFESEEESKRWQEPRSWSKEKRHGRSTERCSY